MITEEQLAGYLAQIESAPSLAALEQERVELLGKQGILTALLRGLSSLAIDDRKTQGAVLNKARQQLEEALSAAKTALESAAVEELSADYVDVTAPVIAPIGHNHPVLTVIDDVVQLFWQMGFSVADGPEIETPWYCFEALNIPVDHPARDMQDTFYLPDGNLPRTHTSSVQVRYMENHQPPIRIIAPGKVYRNEDEDARHVWMFHQIEGLVVDRDITLADLKGTLQTMIKGILGPDAKVRLRPNYFPYTEPSVEMDASCIICNGKGCNTCSGTGWLELGGAGMVHPQVLRNVGIDPEVYKGFAFGFGAERIAAIKYSVPDLREFWRPNMKFLEQF